MIDHADNVDLHTHSCHSDGALTAKELLTLAKERQVDCLSITDHDSISVYKDIKESELEGMRLIVGCEFSCLWRSMTVHIVGLNLNLDSLVLNEAMIGLTNARQQRSELIAQAMEKKGFYGALEGVEKIAGTATIGRPHFAQYLVEKGYVKNAQQAFKKYLGAGKVGDIKAQWPSLDEVCAWIQAAGGVAVVAHPLKYGLTQTKLRALLDDFKDHGGHGIEVISGNQDRVKTTLLAQLADRYELAASVGSDFHRSGQPWADLGKAPRLPESCQPIWSLW